MGRFFAINLAVLMGLGLLSMSSAQAQNAYGGVASDTRGEVSIRAPKPSVAKRYAAKIRANTRRTAEDLRKFWCMDGFNFPILETAELLSVTS